MEATIVYRGYMGGFICVLKSKALLFRLLQGIAVRIPLKPLSVVMAMQT